MTSRNSLQLHPILSVLIPLVDFPLDVVAIKTKYRCQKFKAKLKIICVEFRIFFLLQVQMMSSIKSIFSRKTSQLHVTGLCAGNSPVTGEFPAQRASYAENVSI